MVVLWGELFFRLRAVIAFWFGNGESRKRKSQVGGKAVNGRVKADQDQTAKSLGSGLEPGSGTASGLGALGIDGMRVV